MALNSEYINNLRFTCVRNKYYDCREVDAALNNIAALAEKQQQELERLRAVAEEYDSNRKNIEQTLVSVEIHARNLAEEKRRNLEAELAEYTRERNDLRNEILRLRAELEGAKTAAADELRRFIDLLEN